MHFQHVALIDLLQFSQLRKPELDGGRPRLRKDGMVDDVDCRTPGQLIEKLLVERGWSQRVLAVVMGVSEAAIHRLLAGKKEVDGATAIVLEEVFGVPATRFMDLQKSYDLSQARIVSRPDPERATRARVFGGLPVAEMIKRRWLSAEDIRDVAKVESSLAKFFAVGSMKEIEVPRHAARKTGTLGETTLTQLAWLRRTRQIAEQMLAPKYTRAHGVAAVEKLRALLKSAEELRQVPRILMEAGIRFVLVESLPSAKIDGVCLWLNEAAPVIGMSMRHDRIDNFWFVLRHEMEHVLCEHGQAEVDGVLDTELEGARAGVGEDISEEERAANRAAAEFCVPQKALDQFIARKSPFFAERDIVGFANTLRIHPGLIAGHLQYRTGRYDRFRAHQVKVRALVAPSAMVDGWGDVAPVGM